MTLAGTVQELRGPTSASTGAVGDGETILLTIRPSAIMVLHWGRRWCVGACMFVALGAAAQWSGDAPVDLRHGILSALAVCMARAAWRMAQWRTTTFVLTDRRLVSCTGPIRRQHEIPLRVASLIDIHFPTWGRPLRVGSIGFRSLTNEPDRMRWDHVSKPQVVRRAILDARSRYGR
ncbi:MAG: PH domain-containing protein [Planctomycetota bacterium]|nr:PH domain-containing protein [Planctomycetota bacterium]MDA1105694.1 PH domain-containing protein [Planctomycetota bacterium]